MEADFWHQRWQLQQIAFHQNQVNPLLSRFWSELQLPVGSRVLVPLCGKSADMLWLLNQGYPLVGVELSDVAVEAFFEENQLAPQRSQQGALESWRVAELELLCGDLFAVAPEQYGGFDAIYDRAALIALPLSMRAAYINKLVDLLRPDGQLLLITLEYPAELHQGPPFSISESEVEALFSSRFTVERLASEVLTKQSQGFSRRGLLGSTEVVYRLKHRQAC